MPMYALNCVKPVLSPRQLDILERVASGQTSKEIGAALNISPRTVETHLERMRTKVKAKTTTQLVALVFNPNRTAS